MPSRKNVLDGKGGRFGNAKDGSVTPGSVVPTNQTTRSDKGFGSRREGEGNVVVDAYYDSSTHELVAVMGEAGGGTSLVVARVMGGNAPPTVASPAALDPATASNPRYDEQGYLYDTDYPNYRGASYPLPVLTNAQEIRRLPAVKDWTKFFVPDTYKFDETLPRVPDGVTFLRLERPYSLGSASWSAFLDSAESGAAVAPMTPLELLSVKSKRGFPNSVVLTFNQKVNFRDLSRVLAGFKVLASPLTAQASPSSPRVQGAYVPRARPTVIEISLAQDLDFEDYTYTVTVAPSFLKTQDTPALLSVGFKLGIAGTNDRSTLIVGLNRNSYQYFTKGDLVVVSASPIKLADALGVSVTVYDILMPFGSVVSTHDHSQAAGGFAGGGPAFAQIINASYTGVERG